MKNNKHIQSFNEHQENLNISNVSESKLINFINKLGDFFSIMCPKCDENGTRSRMDKNYYMLGVPDSMYWTCKKCGHIENLPDPL
jgi:hypothetical protein